MNTEQTVLIKIMRKSGYFFITLGMGLLYISLYMGLIVINLRGSSRAGSGDLGILSHFTLIALAGVGLYLLVRKGMKLLRPLAALLAVAGLFCVAVPFFPEYALAQFFHGRPPVIGLCMALFTPVGFFLFFRVAPPGREGFLFGLIMGSGEFLWALLFPLLGSMSPQLPGEQAAYLFSLCCHIVGCAGILLAVALVQAAREVAPSVRPDIMPEADAATVWPLPSEKRAALSFIFAAGLGIFVFVGLHMGMFMPKIALTSEFLGISHFAFLFLLPLAGRLLDTQPGTLTLLCILSLAALFFLGLFHTYGLMGRMPLYYPLNILQQVILLTVCTTTARLLKNHSLLALLIVLAYCLYPAHFIGIMLRGRLQAVPFGIVATSLLLAVGTAWFLWRFRVLLAENEQLWETGVRREYNTATPLSTLQESGKFVAFAASYGLSEREALVMELLAQGKSSEEIAEALAVKTSTVRTYIRRLKQKTNSENRTALMQRYAEYAAAADSHG